MESQKTKLPEGKQPILLRARIAKKKHEWQQAQAERASVREYENDRKIFRLTVYSTLTKVNYLCSAYIAAQCVGTKGKQFEILSSLLRFPIDTRKGHSHGASFPIHLVFSGGCKLAQSLVTVDLGK